ncbi:MAG: carbohydrate ABC transporter permease [Lentisphaerae bacterium]|nr:carbohydrate ABC transporter permease [Lentisphaerota bacterium]
MPIIDTVERKSAKGRFALALIYTGLIAGGLSMIIPFGIMLTGSVSNAFDYDRRSPLPGFLVNRSDRLLRVLCGYFPPSHRGSIRQLRSAFPSLPADWQNWSQIGDTRRESAAWAAVELDTLNNPATLAHYRTLARDYGDYVKACDLRETVLAYDPRYVGAFLRRQYGTLDALNRAWEISIDTFAKVDAGEWSGEPIDQRAYVPLADVRYRDLLDFRREYRDGRHTPFLRHPDATAGFLRPAGLAHVWEEFAGKELGVSDYRRLHALPFPVPANAPEDVRRVWKKFLRERFPLRHIAFTVTPEQRAAFARFLEERFRNVGYMNRLMREGSPAWRDQESWAAVELTGAVPPAPLAGVWMDFVTAHVPDSEWRLRDTLPEIGFQELALTRHKTLAGVNQAYGLALSAIEELRLPFREAALVTFHHHEWALVWDQVSGGYRAVFDYLFLRGRAVMNTAILVILSILINLTVNPLAGYALSRFRLRQTEKIIVFCLATSAFPAAVAAIPGFLLLRDLGLLNTFAALVLPGAASGMSIFMLKGFFDSLPQELFEAATIDGASEPRIFLHVALPLVKPILAVSVLGSFIAAYNGWEWAIVVCQDPKIWTIAVWTYQFSQTAAAPYTVMAAFVVNSIPVLLVFLFCQKVILKGIVLPTMK